MPELELDRTIRARPPMGEAIIPTLLTPSKDLPGQWVAHTLRLDLVTQGSSIEDAISMVLEAVQLVVIDDLASGFDPLDRPVADPEHWAAYLQVVQQGKPLTSIIDRSQISAVVVTVHVVVPEMALPDGARPKVEAVLPQAA